jgi:hypothetical protein
MRVSARSVNRERLLSTSALPKAATWLPITRGLTETGSACAFRSILSIPAAAPESYFGEVAFRRTLLGAENDPFAVHS